MIRFLLKILENVISSIETLLWCSSVALVMSQVFLTEFLINIVFIYLFIYFFRYFPNVISDYLDHNMLTFILCVVCTPHYFKNPYLVSKLIEILFVINPAVQERTQDLNIRMMTNQISADYLPSALMNFYTGKPYIFFWIFIDIFFYKGSIYCFPTSTTLISGLILSYRWGKAPFA